MPASLALKIILWTVALLAAATWLTLTRVELPMHPPYRVDLAASPLGYTFSLALVVAPFLTILYWYLVYPNGHKAQWRCLLQTALLLAVGWFLLDILFANSIFYFPNCKSTLEWYLPGYVPGAGFSGNIPIEEFIFYLFACLSMLMIYIWSSEIWFPQGSLPPGDHVNQGNLAIPVVGFNWGILGLGVVLLVLAIIFQAFVGHVPLAAPTIPTACSDVTPPTGFTTGAVFPLYFGLLLLIVVLPSIFLYDRVKVFINTGALHLTMAIVVLISLIWETTLAIPYGWWGYQPDYMLGLYVPAWFHLPIESVVLWICSSWGTVFIYEFIRLKCVTGRDLFALAFGRRPDTHTREPEPPRERRGPGTAPPPGKEPRAEP